MTCRNIPFHLIKMILMLFVKSALTQQNNTPSKKKTKGNHSPFMSKEISKSIYYKTNTVSKYLSEATNCGE